MSNAIPNGCQYRGKLKAVILDWAGTTVDFGSLAPVRTLQNVFAGASVTLSEGEIRRHMGLPKKDHIRAILSITRVQEEWKRFYGCAAIEADVDRLYQAFIPLQFSCLIEYSTLIPGVLEAMDLFRKRGLKVGTTTGYTRDMLDLLLESSSKAGYVPDCSIAPGDVGVGRPEPFMIYENAVRLQVYPMAAIVKIGDTPVDIHEGRNAGTWSIGVAATGNMVGLSREDFEALPPPERESRVVLARTELKKAGAHYVIDDLANVEHVLEEIEARLASGITEGQQTVQAQT